MRCQPLRETATKQTTRWHCTNQRGRRAAKVTLPAQSRAYSQPPLRGRLGSSKSRVPISLTNRPQTRTGRSRKLRANRKPQGHCAQPTFQPDDAEAERREPTVCATRQPSSLNSDSAHTKAQGAAGVSAYPRSHLQTLLAGTPANPSAGKTTSRARLSLSAKRHCDLDPPPHPRYSPPP